MRRYVRLPGDPRYPLWGSFAIYENGEMIKFATVPLHVLREDLQHLLVTEVG